MADVHDLIVCITYNIDAQGRFTGYEFSKVLTALDAPHLAIPFGRQATFQEELRVSDKAYFADENDGNLEERIRRKFSEAYTEGELVSIEQMR
jgi:hypothetical protein